MRRGAAGGEQRALPSSNSWGGHTAHQTARAFLPGAVARLPRATHRWCAPHAMHAPRAASPAPLAAPAAAAGGGEAAGDELDWQAYNSRWHNLWAAGLQPGQAFDKGAASAQLLELLSSGQLDVRGKRTLVPGCGRGYDVAAFAAAGAALSVGLDLCPDAIAAAEAECATQLAGSPAAAAACQLIAGDFFTYTPPPDAAAGDGAGHGASSGAPLFDAGYDYTFLCALHPNMRQDWAATWARLLAPGGQLVSMVYPVDATMDAGQGPPWPLTPQLVTQLLTPAGFECVEMRQVPAHLSHPSRSGREWVSVWRRRAQDDQ